jgi:hypothetical protein
MLATGRRSHRAISRLVTTLFAFATLAASAPAFAEDTPADWASRLRKGRSAAYLSPDEQQKLLSGASEAFKSAARKTFGIDDKTLQKYLMEDTPEAKAFRVKLLEPTAGNELRELYSEINLFGGVLLANNALDRCKQQFDPSWVKKQDLTAGILDAQKSYRPDCEGAANTQAYTLLQPVDPNNPKSKSKGWPIVYGGNSLGQLLNQSEPILRESWVSGSASYLGLSFPKKPASMSQSDFAAFKMKEDLRDDIYRRAMVTALTQNARLEMQYGGKTYSQIATGIDAEIARLCVRCDASAAKAMRNRTLNALSKGVRADRTGTDPKQVVLRICQGLEKAGYFDFAALHPDLANTDATSVEDAKRKSDEKLKAGFNVGTKKETPRFASQMPVIDTVAPPKMSEEQWRAGASFRRRAQIMKDVVNLVPDGGELLALDALTTKSSDGKQVTGMRLKCNADPEDVKKDVERVQAALVEAKANSDARVADFNEYATPLADLCKKAGGKTCPGPKAREMQEEALEAMIQAAPKSAGEALGDNPFSGAPLCHSLNEIFRKQLAAQEWRYFKKTMFFSAGVLTLPFGGAGALILGMSATVGEIVDKKIERNSLDEEHEKVLQSIAAGQGGKYLSGKEKELLEKYDDLAFGWGDAFNLATGGFTLFKSLKAVMTVEEMADATRLIKEAHSAEELSKMSETEVADEMIRLSKSSKSTTTESTLVQNRTTADPPRIEVRAKKPDDKHTWDTFVSRVKEKNNPSMVRKDGTPLVIQEFDEMQLTRLSYEDDLNSGFKSMSLDQFRSSVAASEVKEVSQIGTGVNSSYLMKLENGAVGVFKPQQNLYDRALTVKAKGAAYRHNYGDAHNEVVGSAVDNLFGFDMVPNTVLKKVTIDGKEVEGSFQLFENGARMAMDSPVKPLMSEKVKLDLFDTLIGNVDRHIMNYMVTSNGEIKAIDNGLSFWQGENLLMLGAARGKKLSEVRNMPIQARGDALAMHGKGRGTLGTQDMAAFVNSEEGKTIVSNLRNQNLQSIRSSLKSSAPELSSRELDVYATRIDEKRKKLLDLIDQTPLKPGETGSIQEGTTTLGTSTLGNTTLGTPTRTQGSTLELPKSSGTTLQLPKSSERTLTKPGTGTRTKPMPKKQWPKLTVPD